MEKVYAPILVGTLNRYTHFKRCIESLKKCDGAEKSELYIALDYPPSQKYQEGYNQILNYINKGIEGFKKVNILKRKKNFGVPENFNDARGYIFKSHDTVIFSEDDNEFSTDFLEFINKGLVTYKDRLDILSVCGYMYPMIFKNEPDDVFLYQGFSAWGYGTWKYKFDKLSFDIKEIEDCHNSNSSWDLISNSLVRSHLKSILRTGHFTRDTYICMHQYLNNMSSVFPKVSRVRNHGHDGSGQHCGNDSNNYYKYSKQDIYMAENSYYMNEDILPDAQTKLEIDNYLRPKFEFKKLLKSPHLIPKKLFKRIFL